MSFSDGGYPRCSGCDFGHEMCQTQAAAHEYLHRLAQSVASSPLAVAGWAKELMAEYENRWA